MVVVMSPKELADNWLFQNLTPAQLDQLATLFTPASFQAGDMIFRQGDPADRVYVLDRGEVELRHHAEDGGCLTIAVIRPRGILGWSAALGRARYTSFAICTQDAAILKVKGADLRGLVESEPDLGRLLLGRMALVVAGRDEGAHGHLARLIRNEMGNAAL
jgi:CRP/FNR family transcriptional regulator, cyclic AMP receptor protein